MLMRITETSQGAGLRAIRVASDDLTSNVASQSEQNCMPSDNGRSEYVVVLEIRRS